MNFELASSYYRLTICLIRSEVMKWIDRTRFDIPCDTKRLLHFDIFVKSLNEKWLVDQCRNDVKSSSLP